MIFGDVARGAVLHEACAGVFEMGWDFCKCGTNDGDGDNDLDTTIRHHHVQPSNR